MGLCQDGARVWTERIFRGGGRKWTRWISLDGDLSVCGLDALETSTLESGGGFDLD